MKKANEAALSDLSRKILSDIKQNRGEATTPRILDAALAELGGVESVGRLIADGYRKASGNLKPEEIAQGAKANASLEHRYAELLARISIKNDERESGDFSGLNEEDLRNTLIALVRELVAENDEFRRLAVMEGIKSQPDLIHEAMNLAGMPVSEGSVEDTPQLPEPEFESEASDA